MITAALLLVCLVLAGAAAAFLVALRRVEARLAVLESRGLLAGASAPSSTSDEQREFVIDSPVEEVAQRPSRDPATEEFVITQLGHEAPDDPVPTVEARLFADIVLRESVVKAASLAYGLRQGLSPANRNRIWFEMRREVKRARKERRAEEREAIREWRARKRAAVRMPSQEESAA